MTSYEFQEEYESDWLGTWLGELQDPRITVTWSAWVSRGPVYEDDQGGMGDAYHIESIEVSDIYFMERGLMNLYALKAEFKKEVDDECKRLTELRIEQGMVLE